MEEMTKEELLENVRDLQNEVDWLNAELHGAEQNCIVMREAVKRLVDDIAIILTYY